MRDLTHPRLLRLAVVAALATAVLCIPRFLLWTNRVYPIWYLEAVIFAGAFVLWAFVFAWHTKYTGRPVFRFRFKPGELALTTLAGIGVAVALRWFLDPLARQATPEDYPANLEQWLAMCLFTLVLSQLFLVFAPFAWLMRLFQNRVIAFVLTVLFGLLVLAIKVRLSPALISPTLLIELVTARLVLGTLSLTVYLRGGVVLTWWWGFLIESRHLLT